MAVLIYFGSHFIALIWLWTFLYISIKQSFALFTILSVIKDVNNVPKPISNDDNSEIQIQNLQSYEKTDMILVPQQSPNPPEISENNIEIEEISDISVDKQPILPENNAEIEMETFE